MRTSALSLLVTIGTALFSAATFAASAPADTTAALKKTLETRYPDVKVLDVRAAVVPGLFEVFTGDSIVYADTTGDHLIGGPMMDTRDGRNLTADALDERNSIDFASLPLDLAIKSVKGDGSRRMAVFADPDCPYCKKLEHEIASLDNVTVYTFLFPLAEVHPDALAKAQNIWCSADRAEAWTQWMREGKAAKSGSSCNTDAIDESRKLGLKLRVGSTPTIFFAGGRRVTGAIDAAQIEARLAPAQTAGAGN